MGKLTEVLKAYVEEHGARRPWPGMMSEYDSGVLIASTPGFGLGFEKKQILLLNLCLCGLGPVKNLCLCGLGRITHLYLWRVGSFTTIDVQRGSF